MTTADPLVAEYRRSRGWDPEPGPTSRISVELSRDLVRRLNRQARLMDVPRQFLIETALLGLVREFEEIDAEEGATRGGGLLGVGAAGRPKARGLDSGYDGDALEVVRVCTTGERNACSMIYGALCRAGFALGYDPIYTYTLESECASCVKAAGFTIDAELAERPGWDTLARPRVNTNLFGEDETPREAKIRWIRRA